MLLTRVVLRDYGAYRGRNEFDLSCTRDRPIVLVGGTNGAGKTTLFESIMLCLYGNFAVGKRMGKKAYAKLLARKIHRYGGSSISADSTSITVEFRFFHDGKETEYQVERSWRNEEGKISEIFVVRKMGQDGSFEPLDVMEEAHWQSSIREMIPRGIAQLFFFDGEKVAKIAEMGSEDLVIKSSFSSLLGLDIVEQLRDDLRTNLVRNLTSNDAALRQEIEKHEHEKSQTMTQIYRLRERAVEKEAEIARIHGEIEELEDKITALGGSFAAKRAESKELLASYTVAREDLARRIREMCGYVLPFSLIPEQMARLREQIHLDGRLQEQRMGEKVADARLGEVRTEIGSASFWSEFDLGDSIREKMRDRISSLLHLEDSGALAENCLFDFSTPQAAKILDIIDRASGPAMSELEKVSLEFAETDEKVARIQTTLARAPADDEIGPAISTLSELNHTLGGLQTELEHIEIEIASSEALLRHTTVKIRDAVSKRYKNESSKTRVDLTEKIQGVLDEYISTLRTRKLAMLERYIVEAINMLMHKRDFIGKVRVDRDTFAVGLFGPDGKPVPRDDLSTGEKQMLAIAILWGLAKTSGRPLPFVIDTPLARLDEAHRDNMIEKFFPMASHQVLVFSTDTEIDGEYYSRLKPHISRSYVLEFVQGDGLSCLHAGYFWDSKGRRVIATR